ncbi:MAG: alanine dehydrogenase [Firmicutes bacterium]|nr:alanine dehydrogenase [Bacillota bacterium]
MIIGVPKEVMCDESRVSLTPAQVRSLVDAGHRVLIQEEAGSGSGIGDEAFTRAGAATVLDARRLYGEADLVVKVKQPLPEEYDLLQPGQILFAYLHLAAEPELTDILRERRVTAVAFETIQAPDGSLPILAPMSEVAGRLAPQIGASHLEKHAGGRGVLLAGIPGVPPAQVVILGGGVVGTNAARIALGMGASVTVLDILPERLRRVDELFGGRVVTLISNPYNVEAAALRADLLIGAVLVPGARAPILVSEDIVRCMKNGAVIVDVAVDQGGTIATVDRLTTHSNPTYTVHGVVHYAVPNIPGAVPRTSTFGLAAALYPFLALLAGAGLDEAAQRSQGVAGGINVYRGEVCHQAVAGALHLPCIPFREVLGREARA